MEPIKFLSKLLEVEVINEDTKVLTFSTPENFEFKAGQYINLAFYKDEKRVIRSYSIFSSPDERGKIKIYFKRVIGGHASKVLFDMKLGDEIEMKGPYGAFTIRSREKDTILISVGTGFGPLRSMILDLLKNGFNKELILLRGYRNEESLCCNEELDNLKEKFRNFKYFDVLSKPKDENYPLKGRVQNFIKHLVSKHFKGDFYLCGLKEMVLESKEKIIDLGFSPEQINFERYD